jgi:hypothetical protein
MISMEELVETKRAELSARSDLTPVTLETFVRWKKRKLRERAEKEKEEDSKKKVNAKSGQTSGLSGRELFSYDPTMAGEEVIFKLYMFIEPSEYNNTDVALVVGY